MQEDFSQKQIFLAKLSRKILILFFICCITILINGCHILLFPIGMKYAEVTPVHRKDDKSDKEKYHPINILPNLSKVYERLMHNQIYSYFHTIFSKFHCQFQRGFNVQHCLLAIIEKWSKTLDEVGEIRSVLTDLSKVFYCIDHNMLIIAKLNASGFEKQWIDFIYSYLTKRKQKTKVDSTINLQELFSGVPQGSVFHYIYLCI